MKRLLPMDTFSPELAPYWLAAPSPAADECIVERRDEPLTPSQEAALVALAERISAARSIY